MANAQNILIKPDLRCKRNVNGHV